MDKRIKKLWVKALRSGKYRRGIGRLKQSDCSKHCKYCCLGVLTDLYCKDNKLGKKDSDAAFGDNCLLPNKVMKWAGLTSNDPKLNNKYASSCNDDLDMSFNEIADLIGINL